MVRQGIKLLLFICLIFSTMTVFTTSCSAADIFDLWDLEEEEPPKPATPPPAETTTDTEKTPPESTPPDEVSESTTESVSPSLTESVTEQESEPVDPEPAAESTPVTETPESTPQSEQSALPTPASPTTSTTDSGDIFNMWGAEDDVPTPAPQIVVTPESAAPEATIELTTTPDPWDIEPTVTSTTTSTATNLETTEQETTPVSVPAQVESYRPPVAPYKLPESIASPAPEASPVAMMRTPNLEELAERASLITRLENIVPISEATNWEKPLSSHDPDYLAGILTSSYKYGERAAARDELIRQGNASLPAVRTILSSSNLSIARRFAVAVLRGIATPEAVDILLTLLDDSDLSIRREANLALSTITGRNAGYIADMQGFKLRDAIANWEAIVSSQRGSN